ncbi:MAG: response regulator [Candidatus Falkowbacteria bacterium]|nr:response regulator [Candidatus Falkowbacteria bacterium]
MTEQKLKRILIAEDEKAYSRALVLKLKNSGFEAESAPDGEAALEAIKNNHFDLLLCDLVMPKVNGFEVIEEIKKQKLDLPVIVLSNLSQADDEKKARALGAIDFLPKSNITLAEVISKVKGILGVA